jgi:ABC-type multidrug transport system fused ATPase/permease subunit
MGGGAKALWVIFVIILPLIGVLIYLIARGGGMHARAVEQAQAQQQAFDQYVRQTANAPSSADELAKLADLHKAGTLSDSEYEAAKAKLLN